MPRSRVSSSPEERKEPRTSRAHRPTLASLITGDQGQRPSRAAPRRPRSPTLESYYEDFAREIFRTPVFFTDTITVSVQVPQEDRLVQVLEEEMTELPLVSLQSGDVPYISFNDEVRALYEVDPAEVQRINQIPDLSARLWEFESVLISLGVICAAARTHNMVDVTQFCKEEMQDRCLFALMHVRQYSPPAVHRPVYQTLVVSEMLDNVLNLDNAFDRTILHIHRDVEILMVAAGLINHAQMSSNRVNLEVMSDDWIRRLTAHNATMLRRTFPPRQV